MRTAYLNCFSGVSGNMLLGACVDAGVPVMELREALAPLELPGLDIRTEKVLRHGIQGTLLTVDVEEGHHHRHLRHVLEIVDKPKIPEKIRMRAANVFRRLAEAESRVHGKTPETIHFHEVGALDAVVDVLGVLWCFNRLGPERVVVSPIHVGTGFVECAHGSLPVPAPATAYLLEGVPSYSLGVPCELVTPTGAALLRELAESFGPQPMMKVERVAYGCGHRDPKEIPNCVRLMIGEEETAFLHDEIVRIETNIDDMNPEIYGSLFDRLFQAGAVDVTLTPVQMKKNRPGTLVTVLCPPEREAEAIRILLRETTTFGVRSARLKRTILEREEVSVETSYGSVRVKIGRWEGGSKACPEYADCAGRAEAENVPVLEVYEAARKAAREIK